MEKLTLIKMVHRVLKTDANLEFLLKLNTSELETLVACIRDRIEHKSADLE